MKLYNNKQDLGLCRCPLHTPRTVNDQPPIEFKNRDFSYIKMQSQHSDKVRHSGFLYSQNYIIKNLTNMHMRTHYL